MSDENEDLEVSVGEAHNELTEIASVLMERLRVALTEERIEGVDVVVIALKGLGEKGGRIFQGIGTTISDMEELAKVLLHSVVAIADPKVLETLEAAMDEVKP